MMDMRSLSFCPECATDISGRTSLYEKRNEYDISREIIWTSDSDLDGTVVVHTAELPDLDEDEQETVDIVDAGIPCNGSYYCACCKHKLADPEGIVVPSVERNYNYTMSNWDLY